MKNKKISKFLAGSLLALSLLGAPKISAQGLEQKVSPKIDFGINYGTESFSKPAEFSQYVSFFSNGSLGGNAQINLDKNSKVINLMGEIQSREINSYKDLIKSSNNFSESQKMVLLASISQLLYDGTYDLSLVQGGLKSQEIFFKDLQNILINSKNDYPLGTCGQISSHIEKLANDNQIKTAAVTGVSKVAHAYDILKLKEETGIVDGADILIAKTKNIEKTLDLYQKNVNSVAFSHTFFEGDKFKYIYLTKEGKRFLDFIGYDSSSKITKNSLINNTTSNSDFIFTFNKKDNSTSIEISPFNGAIVRAGEIGGVYSPSDKVTIFQGSYNHKFLLPNSEITPNLSLITGNEIIGWFGNITFNTHNGKFNFSSKANINQSSKISGGKASVFFEDYSAEFGGTYKFQIDETILEPYSLAKFNLWSKDLGTQIAVPTLNEAEFGIKLNFPFLNGSNISINNYWITRLWEDEFGTNARIGTKNFGLNLAGYLTKSNYAFCPYKFGLEGGLSASVGKLDLKLDGKVNQTDYDGEKENLYSLSLAGKLKL